MSDEQKKPVPEAVKQGSSAGAWIFRLILFGVLAVLLVLAGLDWRAKSQSEETYKAWDAQLEAAEKEEKDVKLTDLAAPKGSPVISKEETSKHTVSSTHTYTWKGMLREYPIAVTVQHVSPSEKEKGESPIVESIRAGDAAIGDEPAGN